VNRHEFISSLVDVTAAWPLSGPARSRLSAYVASAFLTKSRNDRVALRRPASIARHLSLRQKSLV